MVDVSYYSYVYSSTHRPIVYANMSTKPIKVLRAQCGFFFFKSDKVVSDCIGSYGHDTSFELSVPLTVYVLPVCVYIRTQTIVLTWLHATP